jgi:hypothetical protein
MTERVTQGISIARQRIDFDHWAAFYIKRKLSLIEAPMRMGMGVF